MIGLIAIIFAIGLSTGMRIYLKSDTPQVAVTTESMEPTYYGFQSSQIDPLDGDLLLVQKRNPEDINIGDVIVFDNPLNVGERIVHRVIDVKFENNDFYYLTKGDNPVTNVSPDLGPGRWEWVAYEFVHGVIIHRIPHIGWFALEIQREGIRWSLIIIAGLFLLLSLKGNKNDTEETNIEEKSEKLEKKDWKTLINNLPSTLKKQIRNFLNSKKVIVLGIIIVIMALSFTSSIQQSFNQCSVSMLKDNTHKDNWIGTNNILHTFIGIEFEITSHGILNHVSSFEIFVNDILVYRWTIRYSFQGHKTIGAGIVLDYSPGVYSILLDIEVHCSGIFANGKSTQEIITIVI